VGFARKMPEDVDFAIGLASPVLIVLRDLCEGNQPLEGH
jgi:hypothetical protein